MDVEQLFEGTFERCRCVWTEVRNTFSSIYTLAGGLPVYSENIIQSICTLSARLDEDEAIISE